MAILPPLGFFFYFGTKINGLGLCIPNSTTAVSYVNGYGRSLHYVQSGWLVRRFDLRLLIERVISPSPS